MNPLALLKMLGINPDEVMAMIDEFKLKADGLETRVKAIEDKQDHIIALLEGLHDNQAYSLQANSISEVKTANGANHADN